MVCNACGKENYNHILDWYAELGVKFPFFKIMTQITFEIALGMIIISIRLVFSFLYIDQDGRLDEVLELSLSDNSIRV